MNIQPLKKGLAQVRKLRDEKKFDQALAKAEELQIAWSGNAQLSLLIARLVQLSDGDSHSLESAEEAINQ